MWTTRLKMALARALGRSGVSDALIRARALLSRTTIRAVNYHDVPSTQAQAFEEQLRFFRTRFENVDFDRLLSFHRGAVALARPGLILSFDDGFRSHFEVVAPLLEQYGFTGWFFVPAGLVAETREQADRATRASKWPPHLTWDECKGLAERHVVGCHTMTHRRLKADLSDTDRRTEIADAKRLMEDRLGRDVDVFCWVGGEEWSYSPAAARSIREAGYRVSFMTNNLPIVPGGDLLQLQRTNIEASFPIDLVKFQISGVLDVAYAPKRRRVNRLTAT